VGSVFSPHYAKARQRGAADARRHLAINLALYGERRAWVFTEAPASAGSLAPDTLSVAGNTWHQTPDGIVLQICDRSVPWGRPVVGRIVLRGLHVFAQSARPLGMGGKHGWWPRMPVARIEVDMAAPALRWQGHAYHDLNWGDEPLADGFAHWWWMRVTRGGVTDIVYAATARTQQHGVPLSEIQLSLRLAADGTVAERPLPALSPLSPSAWGLGGDAAWLGPKVRLLEDTPFYRRCTWQVPQQAGGGVALHETLDLTRWRRGWVQRLLPFRLRRRDR
jgi:carotenoid 1,2-hydratase